MGIFHVSGVEVYVEGYFVLQAEGIKIYPLTAKVAPDGVGFHGTAECL